MKTNVSVKITLLLVSLLPFASAKAQNVEVEKTQKIYEALLGGNCVEAQQHYEAWKTITGTTDDDIENMIEKCLNSGSSNDNDKTMTIPGTDLIITKKAVSNQVAWEDADMICRSLRLNGSDTWRLPTKDELGAIYTANILKLNAKAQHVYIWGEKEGDDEDPRYPTIDLKTGTVTWAAKVSTIGCYCVDNGKK